MIRAFLIDEVDSKVTGSVREISEDALPHEGLEIEVLYSTLNYKDGMVINGIGRLVRNYPHVPGVDLVGRVKASSDPRFNIGDEVIATGWRIGESYWGGYSTLAKINPDFAIPLPSNLSPFHSMALGTAGLSAMLAIMALESLGLSPDSSDKPVLVTGAAGGVGSIAIIALHQLGYKVAASTGRMSETEYLKGLGADEIVPRQELAEETKRPLETERWAGAIDNVGGSTIGRILGQMVSGSSIASVGLAGGAGFSSTVMPFLLRGVNILGIDSTACANSRREIAWRRLGELIPRSQLESLTTIQTLDDLSGLASDILSGKIRGRVVVDVKEQGH
ncbi:MULTISPECIES: MDR family oxidoreductase [Acidithrix]|uniref:Acrylyl-CoA reductase AcuI n=1 Tax=Acidithrix ferrooxidans TaxID=1280514 RepID=A0A0D8HG19_9ACTN|nr:MULTISPECIES: MDR family oxidoreductase [Acidithrix]KJF16895.1 acrylyl-CoA reductase AcuI [Acidithrix ferrooxidans]CAG4905521.1 unnamed protein product [Acidithrix sp. C25]